jgi:hypothetical protein
MQDLYFHGDKKEGICLLDMMTPRVSCKNWRLGGAYRVHLQGERL